MAFHFQSLNMLSLTYTVLLLKMIPIANQRNIFYFFGDVEGGILTVRFTYRASMIRIIGAGYWRKGKTIYENENQIHE
jgi:hypothetical protein